MEGVAKGGIQPFGTPFLERAVSGLEKIIVIGGGAAGMVAAISAADIGAAVEIIEKNQIPGKKLFITGKGRCNITNATDTEGLLSNIFRNKSFMYSAFYSFDSYSAVSFFNSLGLATKVERGNRVFPLSDKSSDVIKALEQGIKKRNIDFRLNTEVSEILAVDGQVTGVRTSDGQIIHATQVIVATGGLSYPKTGSTGDGFTFAKAMGHKVTKLYPCLVPLKTAEEWAFELQGLSLRNVSVNLLINNKSVFKDFGEMLFTHQGVSGPLILSASAYAFDRLKEKPVLSIDLKPALSQKELDQRILKDFEKTKNKDFKNSLNDLLPQKLIPVIVRLSGIDADMKVNEITKEGRSRLVSLLKDLRVTVVDVTGYSEAVITVGGVCVSQVDPGTMESKLVRGLYFAGEVLDVSGFTGGFNLQVAFSTGYLAGISAADRNRKLY